MTHCTGFSRRFVHASIVVTVLVLPVLVMVPLVTHLANERAEADVARAATAAKKQVDRLLDTAVKSANQAVPLLDRPCDAVEDELAQFASFSPYVRSLVLVQNGVVYCSSVVGSIHHPVRELLPALEVGLHITPMRGTPMVPDQPVVMVVQGVAEGSGVIAVIDGQYFQDIQEVAADEGHFQVLMVHTSLQQKLPSGEPYLASEGGLAPISVAAASDTYPIQTRVRIDSSRAADYRIDLWEKYGPFLLLMCLLLASLAHVFCLRRFSLIGDMRRGMRNGEFFMVYQPIMNLRTGRCCGVEALVRWRRPEREQITPDVFIPLAEGAGLIGELTRHIFKLIVQDLPRLELHEHDHLGINIAGTHFMEPTFLDDLRRLVTAVRRFRPSLVLELTERETLPDDEHIREALRQVKVMGCGLALDDFGTGHSSASYLTQFDVDFLKIDRSFVQGIGVDSAKTVVLDIIITLGQRLNLNLVAEGVETDEQAAYLREKGVQLGQGYLYSPALQASTFSDWADRMFNADPLSKRMAPPSVPGGDGAGGRLIA